MTAASTPPPPPPDLGPAPSTARYPLFADSAAPAPAPATSYAGTARRRPLALWLLAALVVLAIAVAGGLLLLLGPSDGDADASAPSGDRGSTPAGRVGEIEPARVDVPQTAPASVDDDGNRVTFKAANMLDTDPRTCWRMPGDGTGSVVTFTFDGAVTVTEVGLVNGYAKSDPPHDWYAGNRRIAVVAWVFDDGTEVIQDLVDDPTLQTVAVNAIETTTVELRILEVSGPGTGPDGRDFTAISDVGFSGTGAS